jgi:hypothetical protein
MAKSILQRIEGLGGSLSIANVIIIAVVIALAVAFFRGLCATKDGMVNAGQMPAAYPGGPVAPQAGPAPAQQDFAATAVPPGMGHGGAPADPEQLKPLGALKINWLRPPLLSQNPLRNANLTLREDPLIPKVDVGPFHNSTIDQSDRPGLTTCESPAPGPGPMAVPSQSHFANSFASA